MGVIRERTRIRSRYISIVFPIIVILCLTLFILSFLFSRTFIEKAENVLTDSYTVNLNVIGTQYKQMWLNSLSITSELMDDPRVQDYLYQRGDLQATLLHVESVLEEILAHNNYIHSIYLYNAEYGYYSTYAGYEGITCSSDATLQAYLKSGLNRSASFDKRKTTFSKQDNGSKVAKEGNYNSFSLGSPEANYALVVNISESVFRQYVTPQGKDLSENFYLIDGEGYFLSHPESARFAESSLNDPLFAKIAKQTAPCGASIMKATDGKKYLVCYEDQKEMRWRLVYLIPYDKVTGSILLLQKNLLVLTSILLGFCLLLVILRFYYLTKKQKLEKRLLAFLKGECNQKTLPFPPVQDITMVTLYIGKKYEYLEHFHELHLAAKGMKWLYRFLKEPNQRDYLLYLEHNTYCYLSYQKPMELNAKILEANTLLGRKFGFDITSVMVTNQITLDELPAKLQCLRKKLKVLFLSMRGSILLDCEITNGKTNIQIPDTATLLTSLQTSDYCLYDNAIDEIFEVLYRQKSYEHFKAMACNLGLLVQMNLAKKLDLFYPGGAAGWYSEVLSCEEYTKLHDQFLVIGSILKQSEQLCSKDLAASMKEYVHATMHEKELNTAMVAEKFNLPVNFVRYHYRKHTGTSIFKTVSSSRLDTVLHLLEETDLGLNEIRKKAGFGNFAYFYAYFKREKGLSPLQYRLLCKKNDSC
jgi:AraC-like DNA-binding protein